MEAVLGHLRSAIERGDYAVGEKLPSEAELCRRLEVSRPVLREALRALQAMGLTASRTGKGTFVLAHTVEDPTFGDYAASDLLEVRRHVEIPVAGYAALRRTPEDLDHLAHLLDRMERETDTTAWVAMDTALPPRGRRGRPEPGLPPGHRGDPRRPGASVGLPQRTGRPSRAVQPRAPGDRRGAGRPLPSTTRWRPCPTTWTASRRPSPTSCGPRRTAAHDPAPRTSHGRRTPGVSEQSLKDEEGAIRTGRSPAARRRRRRRLQQGPQVPPRQHDRHRRRDRHRALPRRGRPPRRARARHWPSPTRSAASSPSSSSARSANSSCTGPPPAPSSRTPVSSSARRAPTPPAGCTSSTGRPPASPTSPRSPPTPTTGACSPTSRSG